MTSHDTLAPSRAAHAPVLLARPAIALHWIAVSVALSLGSCGRGDDAPPPARPSGRVLFAEPWSAPPSADASGTCVDCHARIAIDWSRTGMARTLGPVSAREFEGLGSVADEPAGYGYRFDDGGGRPRIVETRAGDGTHRLSAALEFAIGSGERDRAFAARRGETVWFAPLEVLTVADGRRRAALAPGHSIQPGSRFSVSITPECTGCHTDAPPPPAYPLNLAPELLDWKPRGISCAACHGRVERHAQLQQQRIAEGAGPVDPGVDPVLRISSLSRVERLSICSACHLQGDARIVLDPRALGPPPPGGDLLARRALFVAAEPGQDVGFVSQTERLVLSRCFLESSSMDCTTCHDPHRTLHEPAQRQRVRDACTGCHAGTSAAMPSQSAASCTAPRSTRQDPEQVTARDCVACHMRFTGVFDVAGVQIHDHYIRRDPGSPSPPAPLRLSEDPDGDWVRFTWPDVPAPVHVDDPGLWMMAWYSRGHVDRALAMVDRPAHGKVAALPMYHHVRGALLEGAGRGEEARAAYERALALDPEMAPSAVNLGLLLGQLGRTEDGLRVLDELLVRFPKAEGALRNRALLRQGAGDLEGVVHDLEAAFDVVPRASLAAALAALARQAGNAGAAGEWLRRAGELEPASPARGP